MNKLLADLSKKPIVPTGLVNGLLAPDMNEEFSSTDEEEYEYENYEQEYVKKEMKKYATSVQKKNYNGMSEVEGVDGMDFKNNPLNVYSNYNFNTTFVKKELPIDSFREKILNLVEVNNVLIIQGPTGCGKTTQVPQYVLDYCREKSEYCNIAVTQPRKIATINVAKRVCEERGWTLGTVCGYQVGLEKKVSPDMLLTYMTTGVLLQKIIRNKSLHQFTHIIIDEIHERNKDLDFLLLIVRRFLFTNSQRTKVILMSATIEAEQFAHYFRCQNYAAPIIYVNKQNFFTKTTFYLEDLDIIRPAGSLGANFELDKPEISDEIWKKFTFLVAILWKLDSANPLTNQKIIGSVLVFLPGINEIEEAHKRLLSYYEEKGRDDDAPTDEPKIKWEIIPLHSSLPNDEQARAFRPAKPGCRKIILSTNIAESSITVQDSYYVIDFCMTKVMTVDPITKYMSLKLEWASHVNCEQRAGRVGRIGNGRVYRLVPRSFYLGKLPQKSIPEMIRAPLEGTVLQAKMLNLNDTPQQILALSMNPPNLRNIELTILSLKEIGGLLQTCRGKFSASDGDITFLGTVMASLPIDVHLSKLIVLGHLFSCLEEAVIMAAGCSIQNIFSIPFQQRFNAYKKLLLWADGSFSDLIALLNLFQVWQSCKRNNHFPDAQSELRWCTMNLVSLKGLREWNLLVIEIKQRLEHLNIKAIPGQIHLRHDERPLIIKIITAGAFYPNFFIRAPDAVHQDEREAVKMVGGRDPFQTVYFTGLDPTQPGALYIRQIKDLLKNDRESTGDMTIGFDGSSKIYVEFKNKDRQRQQVTVSVDGHSMVADTIPGRIPKEVYEAVRKRQLNYNFFINVLPVQEAWRWAEKNGIKRKSTLQKFEQYSIPNENSERNCYTEEDYSPIPALDIQYIKIKVTEYIDAAHFWANTLDSEIHLAKIEETLNKTVLHEVVAVGGKVELGKIYAARYSEDNMFYRCQVISISERTVQAIFIDYGNIQQVHHDALYVLPDRPECSLPPLGVECVLHGVQPSKKVNPKGFWTEKVNAHWKNHTSNVLLFGKVHSVVDSVVYLEVFKSDPGRRQTKSLNQLMLESGDAEPAVESFLSKEDRAKRELVHMAENPNQEAARLSHDKVTRYHDFEGPKIGSSGQSVELKGPYSPLEMRLYGCIESSLDKSVDIEGNSINTVLLDSEPQDYHTRLLVAGYVSQSAMGGKLRLRQTTLMPNVPGLPMLLALLFCPTMRPKVSEDGSRVASLLCGLGYNPFTDKPFYPSHDLVLTLDTELTESEINQINRIRFHMNQGMKLMYEFTREMSNQEELVRTQKALKKDLVDLIYAHRNPVPRTTVKHANVWAKNSVHTVTLKPNVCEGSEDIWPLLWFVRLYKTGENSTRIANNLNQLHEIARTFSQTVDCQCLLCNCVFVTVHEVRKHLISKEHKQNVSDYQERLQEINTADDADAED